MPLRLLCISAHPDDECFAFGGALALSASRGIEISVLCLTDGQAATNRGDASSGKQLGQIRRAEFEASCKVLGVTNYEVLDYQDGQLEREPLRSRRRPRLAHPPPPPARRHHLRRRRRAQHPPRPHHRLRRHHRSLPLVRLAQALHHHRRRPLQPQRLYYLTTNFFLPDRRAPLPAPWTHTLDISSVFDKKNEAFAQHKSQAPAHEPRLSHLRKARPHKSATPSPPPSPPSPPAKAPTSSKASPKPTLRTENCKLENWRLVAEGTIRFANVPTHNSN